MVVEPEISASRGRKCVRLAPRLGCERVSTDELDEALQVREFLRAGIDSLYVDHGVSGAAVSRPRFDAMLADLRPGGTVVYSAEPSRISTRGTIRSSPRSSCFRSACCFSAGNVSKYSCATIREPGTGPNPGVGVGRTSGQSAMQHPHCDQREKSTSESETSSLRIDGRVQWPSTEPT